MAAMHGLAFDKATVRSFDVDGRLHVAMNNISKASVDPYYGHEIPDYKRLGLDPNKVYYLLRDPEELAKAAPTFNNLPILSQHVPVNVDEPMKEIVIGSTGTDAEFVDPYLRNSAVIWVQEDIDDIESDTKKEWSCAYRYTPDMTSGSFRGLRYDGIMRNIAGNHVALVVEGRAGSDVVVGDSQLKGLSMALKSRRALMLHGAIVALVQPKLAQDAKVDFLPALAGVNAGTAEARKATVAKAVMASVKGKLAMDAGLDVSDVVAVIDAVNGSSAAAPLVEDDDLNDDPADPVDVPEDDDTPAVDADGDALSKVMAFLSGKLSEEDLAEAGRIAAGEEAPAMDGDDEDEDDNRPAMDAAAIRRDVMREQAAIREAERAVRPFIGEVNGAVESAADVYKLALDHAGVNLKGVPKGAFKAMVAMLPGDAGKPKVAMDHASAAASFAARFPNAAPLVQG